MLAEAEVCGDLADQLPVRARISCGRDGRRKQGEVALRVDHHGIGLRPERGGQHDVGEPVRRGRLVGVLGDDQLGGLQALDHGAPVRHGGNGIGADDPARLDIACGELFEHGDGARPDIVADRSRGQTPLLLDEVSIARRCDRTLTGQSWPHVTHFAATHRVGLTGQRHRTTAGTADRAGGEMEVADGVGVPGAVGALVEPHRPAAHPLPRVGDHPCGGANVGLGDAGDVGDPLRWIVGEEFGHIAPTLGVLGDEIGVDVPAFDEQVQDPVQQRQVGARFDRQVQVGLLRGFGAPRVDDDQLGAGLHPVRHPQIQDRMAVGHVGTDHEKQFGAVEVGVGAGRTVGAERLLVPGARAGHAQP